MTEDLIAFIRAQLDDDERVAREASDYGSTWRRGDDAIYPSDEARHPGAIITGVYGGLQDHYAEHIARNDPKARLAEIEAKRRILDRYEDALARQQDPEYSQIAAHVCAEEYEGWIIPELAAPYAGRPGWRSEWDA